jgi:histidinol phosphatase-like enzyme
MADVPSPSTSDKPTKKFRNGSSPFKAAAANLVSPTGSRWEWKDAHGHWTPYSPVKARLLERSLCQSDIVHFPGSSAYIVDLRRFVQVNLHSGRERSVRRIRLNSVENVATIESRQVSLDPNKVVLNDLGESRENADMTISFGELIYPSNDIEAVLLTSYGTDIEWLLPHFTYGTEITLVDQPSSVGDGASDHFPLGNLWPGFQVVHPKFEKGGLFESGTMHCKLIVVKRKNSLRIVISSSNLVGFDWTGITQTMWGVDIDLSQPSENSTSTFGADLQEFVSILLNDTSPTIDWAGMLEKYADTISSQIPRNVYLVGSVPGSFSGTKMMKFGQMRLRSILDGNKVPHDQDVQFQVSSIGMLQAPFIQSLIKSVHANPDTFHVVWPTYEQAMRLQGKDHMMLYEKNEKLASRFMTPLVQLGSRKHLLNHSKCMISDKFTYMGSHNLSMSAWGRLIYEETAIQIASFELGIVLIHDEPHPMGINVPFIPQRPAERIAGNQRPWIVDAYFRKVSSGTEELSVEDISCLQPPMSLADFLSLKSRDSSVLVGFKDPTSVASLVDEFIQTSLVPRSDTTVFQITVNSDYGRHLQSFFNVSNLPAIVVLEAGSGLGNHVKVCARLQTEAEILGADYDELLKTIEDCIEETQSPVQRDPVMDNISLLCLDVDGTVVETNTSVVIIAKVADFLSKLDPNRVKIALVTNQGGVGLKHWMTVNNFGDPSTLPSQQEVESRIQTILDKIKAVFSGQISVYMAFRYQSKGGNGKQPRWAPVPTASKNDLRWKQEWRKPYPGMIVAAMKWAGISPFEKNKVLMIGDMDSDEGAAKAAGVLFRRAPEFFFS